MKPLEILIMVALVGAGILLYDTIRGETAPPEVEDIVVQPRAETPAPEVAEPDPDIRVEEFRALQMRIADLEEKLLAMESVEVERGSASPAAPVEPGVAPARWEPGDLEKGTKPSFEPEHLAWFRAMDEAVAEQRRTEATERSIGLQLDRAEIRLGEEDRRAVLDATVAYRARNRGIYRKGADEKWTAEQRREALEGSRQEFRTTLTGLVPREADRVLEALGRYPGFRPSGPFGGKR